MRAALLATLALLTETAVHNARLTRRLSARRSATPIQILSLDTPTCADVGESTIVRVNYRSSEHVDLETLAFSIRFKANELSLKEWPKGNAAFKYFSGCETKALIPSPQRVTFVCVSRLGHRAVPKSLQAFITFKFTVLARGARIELVPNAALHSKGYHYNRPSSATVTKCRATFARYVMAGVKTQLLATDVLSKRLTLHKVSSPARTAACALKGETITLRIDYHTSDHKRTNALSFKVGGYGGYLRLIHIHGPAWRKRCDISALYEDKREHNVVFSCAGFHKKQPVPVGAAPALLLTFVALAKHGSFEFVTIPNTDLAGKGYMYETQSTAAVAGVNICAPLPTPAPTPSTPVPTPAPRTFEGQWRYRPAGASNKDALRMAAVSFSDGYHRRTTVISKGEFWSPAQGFIQDATHMKVLGMVGKMSKKGDAIDWTNGMKWKRYIPPSEKDTKARARHKAKKKVNMQHSHEKKRSQMHKLKFKDCTATKWSNWSPCTARCGRGLRHRTRIVHPIGTKLGLCPQTPSITEECTRRCIKTNSPTPLPTPSPTPFTCPSGMYVSHLYGRRSCLLCPTGKYASGQDQVSCNLCYQGTSAPEVGMARCLPCPKEEIAAGQCKGPVAPTSSPTPIPRTRGPPPGAGTGWRLVRRVKKGHKWHPATDFLRGTASYGKPGRLPDSDATWAKKFHKELFDEFLFSTGDNALWLVAQKKVVWHQGRNFKAKILLSSKSPNAPSWARWYNRGGFFDEDPWISMIDHDKAKSTGLMLYGENGARAYTLALEQHKGANVWIRSSKGTRAPTNAPTPKPKPKLTKSSLGVKKCVLSAKVAKMCKAHNGCCRNDRCHLFDCS